jgi:lipopolysaccharide assembly protein B
MTLDWSMAPWGVLLALAFFAAGWLVARVDLKQLLSESRAMPQSYFRGLNFLVNEQQDKAIEAFIEVTKANPEAVELQFALGNLFRRRGEVDRAIRIHQNLSERTDLPVEQRTTALLELALNYQKSGLLDHAERILTDLSAKSAGTAGQQQQVLRLLLDLYVQENNWQKAIDAAERLDVGGASVVGNTQKRLHKERANFYCELAAEVYTKGQRDVANQHLDAALVSDAHCVRANLLRGEWLAAQGKHADAIATWLKIEHQDPAYLGLAAEQLLTSYDALGKGKQGLSDLQQLQQNHPGLDLLNAIFRATLTADGPQAAYELVRADLRSNPTLVGLDRLLEAQILAAPEDRKQDLVVLKELVHTHSSRLAVYMCKQCGFKAKQFYWHCPACGGWETFPPRRTAEYDSADRHLARLHMEG